MPLTYKDRKVDREWLRSKQHQEQNKPSMLPFCVYKNFTYPEWYNTEIRNSIRERDNHRCLLCKEQGTNRTLVVHHIDYDKRNCKEHNLVALCIECHNRTNYNRLHWFNMFYKYMRG